MNTLLAAFVIQTALCAVLFILIFYQVVRTARLKEAVGSETRKTGSDPDQI